MKTTKTAQRLGIEGHQELKESIGSQSKGTISQVFRNEQRIKFIPKSNDFGPMLFKLATITFLVSSTLILLILILR